MYFFVYACIRKDFFYQGKGEDYGLSREYVFFAFLSFLKKTHV